MAGSQASIFGMVTTGAEEHWVVSRLEAKELDESNQTPAFWSFTNCFYEVHPK